MGDFNPNSTNLSSKRMKRQCGLTQMVEICTRDTGILDWCLTNRPKFIAPPIQLPKIGTSDHYAFLVKQKDLIRPQISKEIIFKRDTRNSCIHDFGHWITSFSWKEVYSSITCQDKFERFYQLLTNAVDKFLPSRRFRIHNSDKPWITTKINLGLKEDKNASLNTANILRCLSYGEIKCNMQLSTPKSHFTTLKLKS